MKDRLNCSLIKKIKKKWFKYAPKNWWGDNIDIRFYLVAALKKVKHRKILDIGCNAGIILSELDENNYKVGTDISLETLKIGQKIDGAGRLITSDANRLPFKGASFDVIVLSHILPCIKIEDRSKFMDNIYALLNDEGRVYITCPNRRYLRYKNHNGAFTLKELDTYLSPYFTFTIKGFNPFPPFPYFLPNRIMAGIPGIWKILVYLTEKEFLKDISCSFFVQATKKKMKS